VEELSVYDTVLVFPEQLTESTRFRGADARCSFLMSLFYLISSFLPGIILVFFDQLTLGVPLPCNVLVLYLA
jgi:hypothetical protein